MKNENKIIEYAGLDYEELKARATAANAEPEEILAFLLVSGFTADELIYLLAGQRTEKARC